jgi:serine protease Do
MRKLILLIVILIVVLAGASAAQRYLPAFQDSLHISPAPVFDDGGKVKVVTEESITIDTVKKVSPSVVTISGSAVAANNSNGSSPFDFSPFPFFSPPGFGGNGDNGGNGGDQGQGGNQVQSIGSGFIVTSDGLIVTNKHVVSDTNEKYQVITSDDKKYDVQKIYRDPLNDIAIVKIDPGQNSGKSLQPVSMGDSSHLQVGQYVMAIGTALGEFRNSVTTGIVSGLGRGITAGSPYEGSVERLDNVIQTSAAINPGNSGGPLLNSSAQVIGINTAVSQSGQNIGFAIPINVIKDSLNNFNKTGQFNRPYLGVEYKTITQDLAIMNDLPQGAYVDNVIQGSPADKAGIQQGDIITKIDGKQVNDKTQLSQIIGSKKVGDTISITLYRDSKSMDVQVTLDNASQQ